MYRVVLADDEREFREWLQAMLEKSDRFQVVGQAGTGAEAIVLVEQLVPDLVLSDIDMPEVDGLDLAHWVRAKVPSAKVILFSAQGGSAYARLAQEQGALAFIPKMQLSMPALDELLKGEE